MEGEIALMTKISKKTGFFFSLYVNTRRRGLPKEDLTTNAD
jgi:hypothetical protein